MLSGFRSWLATRRIRKLRREIASYGYRPSDRRLGEGMSAYETRLWAGVWTLRHEGVIR